MTADKYLLQFCDNMESGQMGDGSAFLTMHLFFQSLGSSWESTITHVELQTSASEVRSSFARQRRNPLPKVGGCNRLIKSVEGKREPPGAMLAKGSNILGYIGMLQWALGRHWANCAALGWGMCCDYSHPAFPLAPVQEVT